MALVQCPECGEEVSAQANVCLKCGYPVRRALLFQIVAERSRSIVLKSMHRVESLFKTGIGTLNQLSRTVRIAIIASLILATVLAVLAYPKFLEYRESKYRMSVHSTLVRMKKLKEAAVKMHEFKLLIWDVALITNDTPSKEFERVKVSEPVIKSTVETINTLRSQINVDMANLQPPENHRVSFADLVDLHKTLELYVDASLYIGDEQSKVAKDFHVIYEKAYSNAFEEKYEGLSRNFP